MAKPQPADPKRSAPRLYLVTPEIGEVGASATSLGAAMVSADIAAVLLRLKKSDERTLINRIKSLTGIVQQAGAALLLDGHADIAARAGADGAHLTGVDAFTVATETLKPARIAGCGGLKTRHDAMLVAERGADYVMFGEPETDGHRPSFSAVIERIEWWAEVFEIPCVAFAMSMEEIAPLVAAGADFIAIGEPVWNDPRGPAKALADAASALTVAETVP